MKKKLFLLILPVCLVFSLWFTSCEEEYEEVTGLWEDLRNTVWTMEEKGTFTEAWSSWDASGKETKYRVSVTNRTWTIGFYGPRNGPFKNYSNIGNNPYLVVLRTQTVSSNPSNVTVPKWLTNELWYNEGLHFDRTGNELLFPDGIDGEGKKHTRSCRISVSGNKLTIKDVKKVDWGVLPLGTYSKVSSDPNYNWGN